MTDATQQHPHHHASSSDDSRRAVVASSSAAERPVVETDVEVTTPDGKSDAVFIHPASGSHPGVLVWTDAVGLRPAMRDIGQRIAAEGYSVLVPNRSTAPRKLPCSTPRSASRIRPTWRSCSACARR